MPIITIMTWTNDLSKRRKAYICRGMSKIWRHKFTWDEVVSTLDFGDYDESEVWRYTIYGNQILGVLRMENAF